MSIGDTYKCVRTGTILTITRTTNDNNWFYPIAGTTDSGVWHLSREELAKNFVRIDNICECGAIIAGSPVHSDWCRLKE